MKAPLAITISAPGKIDALMEMSDKIEVARVNTTNGGIPIYALKNAVKPTAFYLSPIGSTLAAQICKGQLAKRKSEGCIAVEMELAGVQAVCDFYGFEVWDFLSAGDVLSENDYRVEGLSAANHDLDKLFAALEIANRI